MIRIVKVTSVTLPNPNYPADNANIDSMDLVFADGQPMATGRWADIYEGMPAHPYFIQLDVDRHNGYLVKHEVAKDPFIICNLTIHTDDAGLVSMAGKVYRWGKFFKEVQGPVAYIIGTGGTLFLPAKKVTANDIVP